MMPPVLVRKPISACGFPSRLSFDFLSPVSIVSRSVSCLSLVFVLLSPILFIHSPSCTPRARMSYRRARPLPSRQSFFSPRLRGTVVPLR